MNVTGNVTGNLTGPPSDPCIRDATATRVAGVAHAKLNLFLEVLGRRPDGYHELRTVFHAIDLVDDVEVELDGDSGEDVIELQGIAIDGPADRNLALQAAEAFRRLVNAAPAIHVRLHKRIPPGSGMGGGSSDAAFVLRALQRLVAPRGSDAALAVAAREVGADVGFFLHGGSAIGSGRGDELTSLGELGPFVFLLAMPRFSLSTARVYAHVDLIAPRADVSSFVEGMRSRSRGDPVNSCFNRLEAAAGIVEPKLATLLAELRATTGVPWTMTGSGSTLYAPMRSAAEAESLARRVTNRELCDLRVVRSCGAPSAGGGT